MFNFLSNASLQLALNVSDKSHGREVGWLAPPVQLNTSLCFGGRCYRARPQRQLHDLNSNLAFSIRVWRETRIGVCACSRAHSYERCNAQKLKVILLEQVALAPDVYGLSLMEIIRPIGKYVSAK
jgi:hypothetical protein